MESDNLLKLLQQLDPGVVLFDDAFNVLFINQALLLIFPKISREEVFRTNLLELHEEKPRNQIRDIFRVMKDASRPVPHTIRHMGRDRDERFLFLKLMPLLDSCLQQTEADYTNTLRDLALDPLPDQPIFRHPTFTDWQHRWQTRRSRQKEPIQASCALMNTRNPAVIPRNHRVEEALAAAERGDISVLETLLGILSRPYELAPEHETYREPPPPSFLPYRTFCGT